jgi:hypothetical protein
VHQEFILPGKNVNQKFYLRILERLRERVRRMRLEFFSNNRILHHDNAPSRTPLPVKEYMAKKPTFVLEHPAHSAGLTLFDFL